MLAGNEQQGAGPMAMIDALPALRTDGPAATALAARPVWSSELHAGAYWHCRTVVRPLFMDRNVARCATSAVAPLTTFRHLKRLVGSHCCTHCRHNRVRVFGINWPSSSERPQPGQAVAVHRWRDRHTGRQ